MSERRLAASVLAHVLVDAGLVDSPRDLGPIRHLGEGLSYRAFVADCEVRLGRVRVSDRVVVRVPRRDAVPDDPPGTRLGAEAQMALVSRIEAMRPPVRVPRVLGTRRVGHGSALVETFVYGQPVDLRAGRMFDAPWEIVAEAAAACHGVDPSCARGLAPVFASARDHAAARLERVAAMDFPEAAAVAAWAAERLPAPRPARLLHGDLLGQNLRWRLFDDAEDAGSPRLGLVDWERALVGDPAYDLAIVTRGVAQPFQAGGGFRRLLDAYAALAPQPVTGGEVRLHEALLLAEGCAATIRRLGLDSAAARQERARTLRFLERTS